jgi:hypothetical protein
MSVGNSFYSKSSSPKEAQGKLQNILFVNLQKQVWSEEEIA